jgi:hypothetical protein
MVVGRIDLANRCVRGAQKGASLCDLIWSLL